jgi:hypothetical protein
MFWVVFNNTSIAHYCLWVTFEPSFIVSGEILSINNMEKGPMTNSTYIYKEITIDFAKIQGFWIKI